MIEYLYTEGKRAREGSPLKVKLDGKLCGEIRKVKGGFQYFPKGQNEGGDIHERIRDVKASLS